MDRRAFKAARGKRSLEDLNTWILYQKTKGRSVDQLVHGSYNLLIAAVKSDNEEAVRALLEAGANPNFRNPFSERKHSPLHIAAKRNLFPIVQLLIQFGADPGAKSVKGFYPDNMTKDPDLRSFLSQMRLNKKQEASVIEHKHEEDQEADEEQDEEESMTEDQVEELLKEISVIQKSLEAIKFKMRSLKQSRVSLDGDCVICWEANACMLLAPCGHIATCKTCVYKAETCPVCQKQVEASYRAYTVS
jgi:hypothetical protein